MEKGYLFIVIVFTLLVGILFITGPSYTGYAIQNIKLNLTTLEYGAGEKFNGYFNLVGLLYIQKSEK